MSITRQKKGYCYGRHNSPTPSVWTVSSFIISFRSGGVGRDERAITAMNNKTCPKCGESKPLEQFYKYSSSKDGLQSYCGVCARARVCQWNRDNPGRSSLRRQQRRKNNPDRMRKLDTKHKARHRKRHRDRAVARQMITTRLQNGGLTPDPCTVCSTTENIQSHHPDYSKPLEVVWLCKKHHQDLHAGRLALTKEAVA